MSDSSSPSEAPSSGEQEPTMVCVPVVGSSATDNMTTSWNSGDSLSIHETSDMCNLSALCNDSVPTSVNSSSRLSSAICTVDMMSQDANASTSFLHSGIAHDADSTSGSMGVCDEEGMMVDGSMHSTLSVHGIVTQEAMNVSQGSESSEDPLSVVENITAQNFLRESDLMNAASSALGHKKSPSAGQDLEKTDIQHNLLSSLEQHSVSSTQDHMEMQSLLQEEQDMDGQVSSMTDYHLDHSQTSELSVGSTSQLDIGNTLSENVRADIVCLSPSSNSSTSSLDLPISISSGIGLPPVSTIIRSSAKGRFDAFCRPSNISMIMGIPQFLGNNNSFDVMTTMGTIQRLSSSPCESLNTVSLASPMEVSSSRHNTCTDIVMETIDVPLSSSLACSSTSSRHVASIVESRCIKANTVMSSLGSDIIDKRCPMTEMSDSQLETENNLSLPITSSSAISEFPGVIPISEMMSIASSPSHVSQHLSPMAIEEMQKVAEISEHLRSSSAPNSGYSLHSSDESMSQVMISPHFQVSDGYIEGLNQRSQPNPVSSISAIETNVIMSTSNIDSSPKFSVAEIKAIEQRLRTEQSQNDIQHMQNVNHHIENSEVILPDCIVTTQNSDVIYSNVQSVLSSHEADVQSVLKTQNITRSTIIEKNLLQQSQVVKSEPTVITSVESVPSNKILGSSKGVLNRSSEKSTISDNRRDLLPGVNPSAVTASVIQQLLRVQSSPSKLRPVMQRIPRGVITSVMSAKGDGLMHQDILISHTSPNDRTAKSDMNTSQLTNNQSKNICLEEKNKNLSANMNLVEDSIGNGDHRSLSPTEGKSATSLPSLTSAVLPSLFSSLSPSALATLQSTLTSALPLTLQSTLPNVSIGTSTTTSHIQSMQSGLASPPVSTILLPSILSNTLRAATSHIKPAITDSIASSNCIASMNTSICGGLLKSVGLSTVVKQEPGMSGSGPLPPFTVVSGLPPLVKREFSSLATTLLGANHTSAQIPVVTIKQEPGALRASASASEFNPSIILNTSSALPSIASIHIPSAATAIQLPVVVTSTVAITSSALTNPVPSQASTIAFAGSVSSSVATSTVSAITSPTDDEAMKLSDKKYNCMMCKNGSPCGLHPTHSSQGSSSNTTTRMATPPQPLLSGDPAKPFQCTLCGKHLASKNVYQLHLRSHSGEKPFTCNLCGHHFSQKTSLTRHMRSHTGERPFPCDVCGKRFADKERIKIHMRTHTGEKPFACEVCGKRFSQKSTVKRHMSVHTGEKPFKCESCGKGFANRGNLNAHSKTHANT